MKALNCRVPVCNSGSPNPADFDRMAAAMTGTCFAAPVIVNCQVIKLSREIISVDGMIYIKLILFSGRALARHNRSGGSLPIQVSINPLSCMGFRA